MKKILSILITAIIAIALTSPVSAVEYSNFYGKDGIFATDNDVPGYAEVVPSLSAGAGIENEIWNSDI